MTRKKCIKLIMGTMGLPQPRGAEMEKAGPECGVSVVGGLLAAVQRRIIETKTAIIHDRLMGGPAKETQA